MYNKVKKARKKQIMINAQKQMVDGPLNINKVKT